MKFGKQKLCTLRPGRRRGRVPSILHAFGKSSAADMLQFGHVQPGEVFPQGTQNPFRGSFYNMTPAPSELQAENDITFSVTTVAEAGQQAYGFYG